MRELFLITTFFISLPLFSQSMQAEFGYLNNRQGKGWISKNKLKQDSITWDTFIKKHSYPNPTFDSINKTCKYEFIVPLDSMNQTLIYKRILEYLTIKYTYLGDVILYEDSASGRLIVKLNNNGNFNYNGTLKSYNYIIKIIYSVVDNKLKINVLNTLFKEASDHHYQSMFASFPISKNYDYDWEKNLILLLDLENDIKEENLEIVKYIKDYKKDLEF